MQGFLILYQEIYRKHPDTLEEKLKDRRTLMGAQAAKKSRKFHHTGQKRYDNEMMAADRLDKIDIEVAEKLGSEEICK